MGESTQLDELNWASRRPPSGPARNTPLRERDNGPSVALRAPPRLTCMYCTFFHLGAYMHILRSNGRVLNLV